MKIVVILKDGRRFDDVEADDDVVRRGRCEFACYPEREVEQGRLFAYSRLASIPIYHCFSLRTENGVPVFEERP